MGCDRPAQQAPALKLPKFASTAFKPDKFDPS